MFFSTVFEVKEKIEYEYISITSRIRESIDIKLELLIVF